MSIKKKIAVIIAPIALGSALFAAQAQDEKADKSSEQPQLNEKQQKELDAALKNRVAGKPVNCINRFDQRDLKIISDDIFIYRASRNSKTIYVNKPFNGCPGAKRHSLINQRPTPTLCSGEIFQVADLVNNIPLSSCALDQFIPYTIAKK